MPRRPRLDAVVLAAGLSRRMGRPKPLLPAGPGATLLSRALEAAAAVDGRIWVVVGPAAAELRAEALRWARQRGEDARLRVVDHRGYARGLASSVAAGVRAAAAGERPDGILFLVVDQPALARKQVERLVEAFGRRGEALAVAAAEEGELRNPAVFARPLFDELLRLEGDVGARQLLGRYPDRVMRVELGRGPWFRDVDDPEAYRRLLEEMGWAGEGGERAQDAREGWRA
ncbi:MAG: NTP transferase domain-containing protein [Bacillota bacterium]|nr:NTP transferase domain-containing protein [Bacillota bacterium]